MADYSFFIVSHIIVHNTSLILRHNIIPLFHDTVLIKLSTQHVACSLFLDTVLIKLSTQHVACSLFRDTVLIKLSTQHVACSLFCDMLLIKLSTQHVACSYSVTLYFILHANILWQNICPLSSNNICPLSLNRMYILMSWQNMCPLCPDRIYAPYPVMGYMSLIFWQTIIPLMPNTWLWYTVFILLRPLGDVALSGIRTDRFLNVEHLCVKLFLFWSILINSP